MSREGSLGREGRRGRSVVTVQLEPLCDELTTAHGDEHTAERDAHDSQDDPGQRDPAGGGRGAVGGIYLVTEGGDLG